MQWGRCKAVLKYLQTGLKSYSEEKKESPRVSHTLLLVKHVALRGGAVKHL